VNLPWFRVDTDIASHDKIVDLLNDPAGARYRAAFSYICALGHSVAHGTDGHVGPHALPFIWGTRQTATLLVNHGLWTPNGHGWQIRNFEVRQQLNDVTEARQEIARESGRRGACLRWHGPECWIEGEGCTRQTDSPP
jgi:hypothetical protein